MKCVFCDREAKTTHHILPKKIRRLMNWQGKRAKQALSDKTILLCNECHSKLNFLQEPLVEIIKYLRNVPPVPVEFAFIMEDVYRKLNGLIVEVEE